VDDMSYIAKNNGMGLYTGRKDSKGNPILTKDKSKAKEYTHSSRARNTVDSLDGIFSVISEHSIEHFLKTPEQREKEEKERYMKSVIEDFEKRGFLTIANNEIASEYERMIKSNFTNSIRIDTVNAQNFFINSEYAFRFKVELEDKIADAEKNIENWKRAIRNIEIQTK